MPTKITIKQGDIAKEAVDVIVNAANHSLLGGGGVDGAIHLAAGPELLAECRTLGGCATGEAKITKGYNLPAQFVIHTVGPVYGRENGREAELLKKCYRHCLEMAQEHILKTIAFPAISTGVYRFPKDEAAQIAVSQVKVFIKNYPEAFKEIIFVLFDEFNYNIYNSVISKPAWGGLRNRFEV